MGKDLLEIYGAVFFENASDLFLSQFRNLSQFLGMSGRCWIGFNFDTLRRNFQTAVCSSPNANLTLFLLLTAEATLTLSLFLVFFKLDLRGLFILAEKIIINDIQILFPMELHV